MAQPAAKRLKRSLKVRKSSFVVEKQTNTVSTNECSSTRTNVVASESSGILDFTRSSPAKFALSDNNAADPAVSASLSSLRHSLCRLLPGFLGVKASDWKNIPPLVTPSNVEKTQESSPTENENTKTLSTWSPLPLVCRPCAMRTRCRHDSPDTTIRDTSDSPNTEQLTRRASHQEQLTVAVTPPLDAMPGTSSVSSNPARSKPLFKKAELQRTASSSKPQVVKRSLPESPERDACFELMSSEEEAVDAAEPEGKQQNLTPLTSCPFCQTRFDTNLSQVDIDGHIATCFAHSDDDMLPEASLSKQQMVKRPLPESPERDASFQKEAVAAAEPEVKQQNLTPLTSCPFCQTRFDTNLSQLDIDGHIATCFAHSDDDTLPAASSSKQQMVKRPLPQSPERDASFQEEAVAAAGPEVKQQNLTPLTCPFCQTRFDTNLSLVDIDGHIATCFAHSDDDTLPAVSPRKQQMVKRLPPESPERDTSFQKEAVAAAEPEGRQNLTPLTCPFCQTRFNTNLSLVDIDSHIATCFAHSDDDTLPAPSSSKQQILKYPLPESPKRDASFELMSFEEEAVDAAEPEGKKQNLTPLTTCPLCQTRFDTNLSPVDIDGHIAACFAAADDDVMW